MRLHQNDQNGFTLVELLVVISIIALLIAILLPALSKARRQAENIKCLANIRQFGMLYIGYTMDYKGYYPQGLRKQVTGGTFDGDVAEHVYNVSSSSWINTTDRAFMHLTSMDVINHFQVKNSVFYCPSTPNPKGHKIYGTSSTLIYAQSEPRANAYIGYFVYGGRYYFRKGTGQLWEGPQRNGLEKNPRLLISDLVTRVTSGGNDWRYYTHWDLPMNGSRIPNTTGIRPEGGNMFYSDGHGEWVKWDHAKGMNTYGGNWRRIYSRNTGLTPYAPIHPDSIGANNGYRVYSAVDWP